MSLSTVNHGVQQVAWTGKFEFHECGVCHVTWGMPAAFIKARRDDREDWCCPNGHTWSFSGPSEEERLRRELKRERERLSAEKARRDQVEASLRATKGVVTRQKKKLARVANGVCPCCNRHFADLERHMSKKHPGYVDALITE